MSWFGRRKNSGDARAETGFAAGLAVFLVHATEGGALRQAIGDANVESESARDGVSATVASPCPESTRHSGMTDSK